MSRRTRHLGLLGVLLILGISQLNAQVVTYTWTGRADGNQWTDAGNWLEGVAPPEDVVNTRILFNHPLGSFHIDYGEIFVNQLSFQGITRPLELHGGWDTTNLGSGGINYNPAQPVASTLNDAVSLRASQVWNIQSGRFHVEGPIGDDFFVDSVLVENAFEIEKTGAGSLVLENANSGWDGGLKLTAGRVVIFPHSMYSEPAVTQALGTGTLTFNGGTLVAADDKYYSSSGFPTLIRNNVVVNSGLLSVISFSDFTLGYDDGEGFSRVDLKSSTTVHARGLPLIIEGRIKEAGGTGFSLTLDSRGALILAGDNDYTGGTIANKGAIIFSKEGAIPDTGSLRSNADGYVGRMFDPTGSTLPFATYLGKFDKANTNGSIGFDTDLEAGSPTTFTDAIDLTGFHADARLGSATEAILTGTITPQGTNYRFGGGGGALIVSSTLTGARAVVADSPALAPLILGLGSIDTSTDLPLVHSGNTFTGGVSARNSAVIFGPGAMPASGAFTLLDGGYIGTANTNPLDPVVADRDLVLGVPAFLGRFPGTTDRGIIGFDFFGDGTARVESAIDLSGFTDSSPGIFLGSASSAKLTGLITPQGGTYRFAGYRDGRIEIASVLSGARNVIVGDPANPATFGDFLERERAAVVLSGDNTYTGGTTLNAGELVVGQGNGVPGTDATTALGTGALTVNAMTFPTGISDIFPDEPTPWPQLDVVHPGTIIPNAVVLNTTLGIAESPDFRLDGIISGPGGLFLEQGAGLTLGGSNTFSGGIYVSGGATLTGTEDTAFGTGAVSFGGGGSTLYLESTAPVIGGLDGGDDYDSLSINARLSDTILTINQAIEGRYSGEIRSEYPANDAIRFVKDGAGTLIMEEGGLFFHHGVAGTPLPGNPEVSLQVNAGRLVLGSSFYIENSNPTFWVNGGTLAVDDGHFVQNPLVVTSGRLEGDGGFLSTTIGATAILAPGLAGFDPVGTLEFSDLTLGGGGLYEWNLIAADPLATNGADLIEVFSAGTLAIDATSADRFTLKLISLLPNGTPGTVSGFSGDRSYTWTIFSTNGITGFDPTKFILDASGFFPDLPIHSLTLAQVGNDITLTFQPVPEPSTYALMALGLGIVWLGYRRRHAR